MSAKPLKLFVIKDKKNPNSVPRLIKAETKGQVSKFLSNSTSIEPGTPLDVAEIMGDHPGLVIEDASAVLDEGGSADTGGDPNAGVQPVVDPGAPAESGVGPAAPESEDKQAD